MHFQAGELLIFSSAVIVAALPARRAVEAGRSSIVVFGDSFSDNGNGSYRISNGTWPLTPPYYQGHFSNGPVWAQYLSSNLTLPLYDYAVGGATTSNVLIQGYTGPDSTIPVPSVADQVSSFLANTSPQNTTLPASVSSTDFESPLFVVFAGANDVFFNVNISAAQSYLGIQDAVTRLLSSHPSGRMLTIAPPDLSRLPYGYYADEFTKFQLRTFANSLASLLSGGTARPWAPGLGAATASGKMENVDLRGLFDDFEYFAEPSTYGFAPLGKYGSCLVGVYGEGSPGANGTITQCGDVQGRVYWDEYHPTTLTHSWIAQEIRDALGGLIGF